MHTPVASELTAMCVLKGEKEVKKKKMERKNVRSIASVIITGRSMKTSTPCSVAVRAATRHMTV